MKGDFTRFTHRPAQQYAGVLMQQGRVQLDADWNEQVELSDQRWRTQTVDTIGACGVPADAPGYLITPDPAGPKGPDLVIGAGRIYVDGLLHELAKETRYLNQLDLPAPFNLPTTEGTRTDLIYLDVWRRHITAVEDTELLEPALGGPDTATRLQTVAQVRFLPDVDKLRCGEDPTAWKELVKPSGARLTATAVTPAAPGDPCLPEPADGIRGLENRLYRVEIFKGGTLAEATFVWSRDNGSVVTAVKQFLPGPANQVEVHSLGRDPATGFRRDDMVEVLSDATELAGIPGTIARVVDVDTAQRLLSLSVDASAHDTQPSCRVRRWDQPGEPIAAAAGDVQLDPGIQVKLTGGPFRTGDFWLIPARAVTGEIEKLNNAPPRGIDHHFCRLALVTWKVDSKGAVTATVTDCRRRFPPLTEVEEEGCCTVTVGDGITSTGAFKDIQKAVDSLESGGQVCVRPGTYRLDQTLEVTKKEVVLAGCGGVPEVVAPDGAVALRVRDADNVRVESLRLTADAPEGAVRVEQSNGFELRGCEVTNRAAESAGAVFVDGGADLEVAGCRLAGQPALSLRAERARVEGNHLLRGGLWLRDGSAEVTVADNRIEGGQGPGVALGGLAAGEQPSTTASGVVRTTVAGNRILAMGGSGVATVDITGDQPLTGARELLIAGNRIRGCAGRPADPGFDPEAAGGIVLRDVAGVRVAGNLVVGNGGDELAACGIFVHTCQGLTIEDNTVAGNGPGAAPDPATAYQAGIVAMLVADGLDGEPAAAITGNQVATPLGPALLVAGVGDVSVTGNTLASDGLAAQPFATARLGGAVCILDAGAAAPLSEAAVSFAAPVKLHLEACPVEGGALASPALAAAAGPPGGRVLFAGNQVRLRLADAEPEPPSAAVAVICLDDAAVLGNQLLVEIADGLLLTGLLAAAPTLRTSDNRLTETPCRALVSCLSAGLHNTAVGNQATHCILVTGTEVVDLGNLVQLTGNCATILNAVSPERS
jgi:hypothetical protein